jgi:hypothetical protein
MEATLRRMLVGGAMFALLSIAAHTAAAQPAPAQAADAAPSAERLALARQVIAASGMDASMTAMIRKMSAQITAMDGKNLTADRQAKLKAIGEAEGDVLARLEPQIVDNVTTGYARSFTEGELRDMVAFYQSPSGRSMVAKLPQFTQRLMTDMIALGPQMRRDIWREVCAKTACTNGEKALIAEAAPAKP